MSLLQYILFGLLVASVAITNAVDHDLNMFEEEEEEHSEIAKELAASFASKHQISFDGYVKTLGIKTRKSCKKGFEFLPVCLANEAEFDVRHCNNKGKKCRKEQRLLFGSLKDTFVKEFGVKFTKDDELQIQVSCINCQAFQIKTLCVLGVVVSDVDIIADGVSVGSISPDLSTSMYAMAECKTFDKPITIKEKLVLQYHSAGRTSYSIGLFGQACIKR